MEPTQSFKQVIYYIKYFRIIFLLVINVSEIQGQEEITFDFKDIKISSALDYLIKSHDLIIIYPDNIKERSKSISCKSCSGENAIASILKDTNFSYKKLRNQYVVYFNNQKISFSLYGRSIDKTTGEAIPYANIYIPEINAGDISNQDGIFSIPNIPEFSCTLMVSYIGYEPLIKELQFPTDETVFHEIRLSPRVIISDEVSILGREREFMVASNIPGQISFSPKHVATLPNLGEVDIFRSMQYLPGVQLALGSTSELYIRGGSSDHNLISLDGMNLYQTSHMFGFLSNLPVETIKDVQIYKGYVPANFGGRASSVVELTSRSGNNSDFTGSFYGNLMSSGILAEFPFFKKGSLIFNFKKSRPSSQLSEVYKSIEKYMNGDNRFNLITEIGEQNISQSAEYDIKSSYDDFFGRFSYLINPKHRIAFTYIAGSDSIFEDRGYYGFSNILESETSFIKERNSLTSHGKNINLYSQWNNKYSTQISISSYSYKNNYFSKYSSLENDINSLIGTAYNFHSLSDHSLRFIQQYKTMKNHNIFIGFEENIFSTLYRFRNTESSSVNNSSITQKGYLFSFFLRNSYRALSKWEFDAGIRFSYFDELEKLSFEPRFAIICKIMEDLSANLSYGVHNQFVHRLEKNNNSNFSKNNWFLSSERIPIILSENIQLGFSWDKKDISSSASLYIKKLDDFFQPKNSFSFQDYFFLNNNFINPGQGKIKGLEVQFRKAYGVITGWISYHKSSTKYIIADFNKNKQFSADHEKNHEIKTVLLGRVFNTNISASWVFSSGRPFTDIEDLYVESGSGYEIFTKQKYNNQRIPSSHHLDISFSKTLKLLNFGVDLGFSIYNIYNKNNVAHKRYNPFVENLSIKDVSMFGITPSIFTKIVF